MFHVKQSKIGHSKINSFLECPILNVDKLLNVSYIERVVGNAMITKRRI